MNELSNTSDWTDTDWNKFRDWLTGMLKISPVTVTFVKSDGTERVMKCTLQPESLPPVEVKEGKTEKKKSDSVISAYDLEAKGWRSFTVRKVKHVSLTIGEENGTV
jgi:hypothetical protein